MAEAVKGSMLGVGSCLLSGFRSFVATARFGVGAQGYWEGMFEESHVVGVRDMVPHRLLQVMYTYCVEHR